MRNFLANVAWASCPECHKSLTWHDLLDTSDGYTVACWHCGTALYTLNGQGASRQAWHWVSRELLGGMRDGFILLLQDIVRFGGGSTNPPS